MRILMISQFYPPIVGGEESMVYHLSQALARRGHDVAVATFGDAPAVDQDGDVTVYRIRPSVRRLTRLYGDDVRRHAPPGPDPEALIALRRIVTRHRPDVVHGHNWLVHSFVPLRRRRIPLVVSLHDYSLICATKRLMHFHDPCSGPALAKCLRCSASYYGRVQGPLIVLGQRASTPLLDRAVDLFMPVSRYVAVRTGLEDGSTPYEVVPNFLPDPSASLPAGSSAEPSDDDALEHLPRVPFILFAGDLSRDKGVGVLLEAHRRMRSPIDLVLVGRSLDVEIDDAANVHVLPPVPRARMAEAWSRCAIAVVPSVVQETFGLVALEAMRAGRATVVSSAGNLPALVQDEVTGLVARAGDASELAVALDRLAADEAMRTRLGEAAARSSQEYTESAIIPRIEGLYDRVRTRGARAG
jgi:glycosyltransferase involved in cell wall biosynthesis